MDDGARRSPCCVGAANERWHFAGFSKAQEARKARFTQLALLDRGRAALPLSAVRRHLLVKDLKVFLRDVSQWSQLLLLLALVLVYLYNFRVLDLERIPYMSGVIKNVYAFVNLGDGGVRDGDGRACDSSFRRCRPKGAAFWIIRTAPISMRDFLWSKFWTGLRAGAAADRGADGRGQRVPRRRSVSASGVGGRAIVFMAFALVGLATGLGARYPRFAADNPSQVAGSYGGVAFMIVAVLFIIVMIVLLGWPSSVYLFAKCGTGR